MNNMYQYPYKNKAVAKGMENARSQKYRGLNK
jgi:hypothetical protein